MLSSLRLAAFTLSSLLFVSSAFSFPLERRDQLCNGHAELCNRPYGNTTFLGSHDSFAFSGNPFALARTQEVDLESQLRLGARALQVQAHMQVLAKRVFPITHPQKGITMRFTFATLALFDGGSAENYLHKVKLFLDAHPNEVLTIIIANPEVIPLTAWKAVFEKTGVSNMTYVPPQPVMPRDDWPTLGAMISSGKRVVVFIDKGAEARTESAAEFILPEFQMLWEDKPDPTDISFPCKVDRTAGPLAPSRQLNLINHNLNANIFPIGRGILIPDRLNSPRTNGVDLIMKHVAQCAPLVEYRNPNFVLVDFVNVGQGLAAVNKLNGF